MRAAISIRATALLLLGVSAVAFDGSHNLALGQAPPFAPQIIPAVPTADQPFTLRLLRRDCDSFQSDGPTDRVVELDQDRVVVTVEYIGPLNAGGCTPGSETPIDWTIDPLPMGTYILVVVGRSPIGDPNEDILASLQLTVQPGGVIPVIRTVPAVGTMGFLLLALATMLLGWRAIRG